MAGEMGKIFDEITPQLQAWIAKQHMFFVATAPLDSDQHVNCSPKGMDTFRILDSHTVCYFDYTGSGAETIAHIRENQRIVFMFCAFEGPPKILRLHGTGAVLRRGDPDWQKRLDLFSLPEVPRAIICANITRISDSCGFGVPLMDFKQNRNSFQKWSEGKSADDLANYRRTKNARSIDGLAAWDEPD
jgi:Pyridoxamine 5'-phosphate oxidase